MFKGVCPVVNVPFNEDYSVDYKGLKNIVDYETAGYESIQNVEYISSKNEKSARNQILSKK